MGETAASIFFQCQFLKPYAFPRPKIVNCRLKKHGSQVKAVSNSWHPPTNKSKPSTVTYRSIGDIPLDESRASFDQYLEDKPSVLRAVFRDKQSNKQLNQEEWRINVPPRKVLFLTVSPVVDIRLRCKSNGANYPPEVPRHIKKILEVDLTRWNLLGLYSDFMPSHLVVNMRGAVYSEREQGGKCKLKNHIDIEMSFVIPPALSFVPENVFRSIIESVLKAMVEEMKHEIIGNLLAGYVKFKRDKLRTAS